MLYKMEVWKWKFPGRPTEFRIGAHFLRNHEFILATGGEKILWHSNDLKPNDDLRYHTADHQLELTAWRYGNCGRRCPPTANNHREIWKLSVNEICWAFLLSSRCWRSEDGIWKSKRYPLFMIFSDSLYWWIGKGFFSPNQSHTKPFDGVQNLEFYENVLGSHWILWDFWDFSGKVYWIFKEEWLTLGFLVIYFMRIFCSTIFFNVNTVFITV